jgi:threonine aldolase
VLAAAGMIALEESPNVLPEDHANAKRLATGIAELRGIQIDPETVQTNIVIFDVAATGKTTAQISQGLKENGVLANGINAREMRMLTHYDVSCADIEKTVETMRTVLGE